MLRGLLRSRPLMAALVLVAIWSTNARAQIVNVQPLLGRDIHAGLAITAEGALDYRTGNISLLQASASAIARYIRGRHTTFIYTRGEFGVRNLGALEQRFLARHFEHLRYRILVWHSYDWEAFVQNDSDQFRRLATRVVTGTGPRVKLVTTPIVDAAMAALYMFEVQTIAHDTLPDHGLRTYEHRLSAYVIVAIKLSDRLRIGQAVYYQPRFDHRHDMRVLSESEMFVTVSRYFGLKLTATLAYDQTPPIAVRELDTALKVAVSFNY